MLAVGGLRFARSARSLGRFSLPRSRRRGRNGDAPDYPTLALGLTVDFFYKGALARDAFEASLGYLLPDELKEELRWIYGQQLIAVQHEEHIVLRPLDGQDVGHPRRVRVEFETWRTMRNVSNQRVEHPTFASVEEWFRGEESGLELIECVRGDERYSGVPSSATTPKSMGLQPTRGGTVTATTRRRSPRASSTGTAPESSGSSRSG